MEFTPNCLDFSFIYPERLGWMRAEDPVQLQEYRIAVVLGEQIAPAMLVIETEAQKLTEVIRKVGSDAASLQPRIKQRRRPVPAHAGVFSAVKLPLAVDGVTDGFSTAGLQALNGAGHVRRFGCFGISAMSEHQL